MKKTLIALVALSGLAMGDIALTLPGSTNIAKADAISKICSNYNADTMLTSIAAKDAGIYVGFNNGDVGTNWGTNGEGTWTSTDNVGSLILAGRNGADGEGFGIVINGSSVTELAEGTKIKALTFSFDIPALTGIVNNSQNYRYALGVYDATGTLVKKTISSDYNVTNSSPATTLSVAVNDITWSSDYKVVAVVKGVANSPATTTYTISNIMLTATPEPATATLSLLALAGLASRRRRH